jgi:two-component sensor histidine kinase
MVVTELVTNAFKYAYPAGAAGDIRVTFRKAAGGRVSLAVADDGIGWSGKGVPHGTGVGTRIVGTLARGLGATLTYGSAGAGCRVELEFEL